MCDVKALKRAYALYRLALCNGVDGQERRYERGRDGYPEHHYPRKGPNANIVAPSVPASSAFSTPHTTKLATMASTKHIAVMMIDSEQKILNTSALRAPRRRCVAVLFFARVRPLRHCGRAAARVRAPHRLPQARAGGPYSAVQSRRGVAAVHARSCRPFGNAGCGAAFLPVFAAVAVRIQRQAGQI